MTLLEVYKGIYYKHGGMLVPVRGSSAIAFNRLRTITQLDFGVTVTFNDVEDPYSDGLLINESWMAGRDIFIGNYDCDWHRVVSLAHEIGHMLSANGLVQGFIKNTEVKAIEHSTLINESIAWQSAFDLLTLLNIEVPEETMDWASKQLATYAGYKG